MGEGTGESKSPASLNPFSRLPYFFLSLCLPTFIVFLPLSCKSRCLTPYSNRECFGLVQNKTLCFKSNYFALSSAIIEAAFLRHKFTPRGKIFSVLWTKVVRSELPGRSSMDGFFPTTPQNTETDQNGLWRHFTWLALLFLRRISIANGTDETLTRLTQSTHMYMCHAISFMSYDLSDLEKFPISQEVKLFFFSFRVQIFVFWLFSRINFALSLGKC